MSLLSKKLHVVLFYIQPNTKPTSLCLQKIKSSGYKRTMEELWRNYDSSPGVTANPEKLW